MKITNPSNNAIENISIFGVKYSIEAEGTLDNVPETHARYWQENLHKFLILRKDKLEEKKEEVMVEIPKPKVEEVIEATLSVESEPSIVVTEEVKEEVEVKEVITPIVKEVKVSKTKVK